METFDAETLLELLNTYETALGELRRTADQGVEGLLMRLNRHRAEVISEIANRQSAELAAAQRSAKIAGIEDV